MVPAVLYALLVAAAQQAEMCCFLLGLAVHPAVARCN
jgi:hypothetical protein